MRPFHADAKDFGAAGPVFSPDGGWLAYHAGAGDARPQVFVEPFPATGARYQIAEGVHPLWSRDGTELFINLLSPGFFAYRIATAPRFTFSPISRIGHDGVIENTPAGRNYDLMPDGKRLVVVMRGTDTERSPREVEVVLNWVNTLRNP